MIYVKIDKTFDNYEELLSFLDRFKEQVLDHAKGHYFYGGEYVKCDDQEKDDT